MNCRCRCRRRVVVVVVIVLLSWLVVVVGWCEVLVTSQYRADLPDLLAGLHCCLFCFAEFLIAARKAVAEGKVIDMANAILQTAGDEDFLQEIVQDLLEEAIQHFANMRAAVPERNVQVRCAGRTHTQACMAPLTVDEHALAVISANV